MFLGKLLLLGTKYVIIIFQSFSARLDGTTEKLRSKLVEHKSIEDWLELGEIYNKPPENGKKRVGSILYLYIWKTFLIFYFWFVEKYLA